MALAIDILTRTGPKTWSLAGTLAQVQSMAFELIENGLYGGGDFTLAETFEEEEPGTPGALVALSSPGYKQVVFKQRLNEADPWTELYRGLIRRPVRRLDLLEERSVECSGLQDEFRGVDVTLTLIKPGGADLAAFFLEVATDYALARTSIAYVETEDTGIRRESLELNGDLWAALAGIADQAGGSVYWGVRARPTDNKLVLFLRKKDLEAEPDYVFTVGDAAYDPAADTWQPAVSSLEYPEDAADIQNAWLVEGGQVRYRNLAPNPSFERPIAGGGASGNLLTNGDFELGETTFKADPTLGWKVRAGDPSVKAETGDEAHSGKHYVEMDGFGGGSTEAVFQRVGGIAPGNRYSLTYYLALENSEERSITGVGRVLFLDQDLNVLATEALAMPVSDPAFGEEWTEQRINATAPPDAAWAEVEFETTGGGAEKGLLVDTVRFFDTSSVYQDGWTIETATNPGGGGSVDPAGVHYTLNWMKKWADGSGPDGLGLEFGAYGVEIALLDDSKKVRLLTTEEASVEAKEKTFYSLGVFCHAPAGAQFRAGVVCINKDNAFFQSNEIVNVTTTEGWARYWGGITLPAGTVRVLLYIEPLSEATFRFDGVQFMHSPQLPTANRRGSPADPIFYEADRYRYFVAVEDCYPEGDPRRESILEPPDGFGLQIGHIANENVKSWEDAVRLARARADTHALPLNNYQVEVKQTMTLEVYRPDGLVIVEGFAEGFSLPAQWPSVIRYSVRPDALVATFELAEETRRTEALLGNQGVGIAATLAAGGSVSDPLNSVPPILEQYFVGTHGDLAGDGLTWEVDLPRACSTLDMVVAVRGYLQPLSRYSMQPSSNGEQTRLRVAVPGGFVAGDRINVRAVPFGAPMMGQAVEWFEGDGSTTSFELPADALPGSVWVTTAGYFEDLSEYAVLNSPQGQPRTVEFDAAPEAGIRVGVVYTPQGTDYSGVAYRLEYIATAGQTEFEGYLVPLQHDGQPMARAEVRGYHYGEFELVESPRDGKETLFRLADPCEDGDLVMIRGHYRT